MTTKTYTTAINFDQNEWSVLQLVEEPGHGEGFAGYFYYLRPVVGVDIFVPVATRDFMGGPIRFEGKRYSQNAPGTNVYD